MAGWSSVVSSSAFLDLSPRRGVPQNEVQDRFIIRVLYPFHARQGKQARPRKACATLAGTPRAGLPDQFLGNWEAVRLQFASQPQDLGVVLIPTAILNPSMSPSTLGPFRRQGQPDISVGGKKKEHVENFKAAGCGELVLFHQPRQWNSGSVS